jgi:hypothetical protein
MQTAVMQTSMKKVRSSTAVCVPQQQDVFRGVIDCTAIPAAGSCPHSQTCVSDSSDRCCIQQVLSNAFCTSLTKVMHCAVLQFLVDCKSCGVSSHYHACCLMLQVKSLIRLTMMMAMMPNAYSAVAPDLPHPNYTCRCCCLSSCR